MNPFTESTVARPLVCQVRPQDRLAAKPLGKRRRRSPIGMAPCPRARNKRLDRQTAQLAAAQAPAAGAPAAALSIAGTFASAAGLLAAFILPGLAFALDVNVATQEQLREVRGIGPKTAQIIIEERSRGGRYASLEDLSDRVKGIGAKKAAALQAAGLSAGSSGAAPTAATKPIVPASATKPVAPAPSVKPPEPAASRSVFRLPSTSK